MSAEAPVMVLEGVEKTFELGLGLTKVHAVRGVSLEVYRGEIFGFLGPNGAGKTTTMKCAMGLIKPTAGRISILGGSIEDPAVRRRVGYLPEHPYFYDYLTATEILDFFGRLYEIPKAQRRKRIGELLELVGLADARHRTLRRFSKGMLQRIGTAQALLNDPELVVFDEPLSGLDPMGRRELREVIVRLKEAGKTVFVTSHILHDIEMMSDRVALIINGRVERIGTLDELLASGGRSEVEVSISSDLASEGRDALEQMGAAVASMGRTLSVRVEQSLVEDVLRVALDGGAKVLEVSAHRQSLEDVFVREAEERSGG